MTRQAAAPFGSQDTLSCKATVVEASWHVSVLQNCTEGALHNVRFLFQQFEFSSSLQGRTGVRASTSAQDTTTHGLDMYGSVGAPAVTDARAPQDLCYTRCQLNLNLTPFLYLPSGSSRRSSSFI